MKFTAKEISITALFTALVFAVTRFIQIPIPLGYFNIGNTVIMLSCVMFPSPVGIIAGCLGSALADLTSYPAYTIPTAIIKFAFPLIFYIIAKIHIKDKKAYIPAAAISTIIPLLGYTLTGAILYGGLAAGLAQFPGLFLEYVANLILFAVLYQPAIKLSKQLI